MKYTKTDIKRTAQTALYNYIGIEPKLSQITLLESSDDRTYILFRIAGIEYRFFSYICDRYTDERGYHECVWCGDGTVERLGRRMSNGLLRP